METQCWESRSPGRMQLLCPSSAATGCCQLWASPPQQPCWQTSRCSASPMVSGCCKVHGSNSSSTAGEPGTTHKPAAVDVRVQHSVPSGFVNL